MENFLICVTEKPVKQKHISWSYWETTENRMPIIVLNEIVENFYRHPQAPDDAFIQQIEMIERKRFNKNGHEAASVMLLKHALDNCSLVNGNTKNG